MLINFWVHEGPPVTKNKENLYTMKYLIVNLNVDTALKSSYAMLNMNL